MQVSANLGGPEYGMVLSRADLRPPSTLLCTSANRKYLDTWVGGLPCSHVARVVPCSHQCW